MTQTGKISGALLLGFLVYVTLLGHLPQYFSLLWKRGSSSRFGQSGQSNPGGVSVPGYEDVPGGGANIIGNQNRGGGYTPDPLSPNVLLNDNWPYASWSNRSMRSLMDEAVSNLRNGGPL